MSSFNPFAKWSALVGGEFMLAPAVMALRMPILVGEAFASSGGRPETVRAVAEKLAAASEGMALAQLSMFRSAIAFWPLLFAGQPPAAQIGAAVDRSIDAALKPAGREVRANHRRLSRRGKR
jgi:hypothetical protein